MTQFQPPVVMAALQQLRAAIRSVDRREIDELKTPWAEIEKSIIKVLGGGFEIQRPDHQAIALGLSGIYAARLMAEQQAFWFPNREALEGGALGFAEALLVVAPFGAVADALSHGNLARLDEMSKEIGTSLAKARFSPGAAPGVPAKLTPEDFQRLFDPGFVQFVALDSAKLKSAWESKPPQILNEVRDAFSRIGNKLPPEVRGQLETRLVSLLQRLDPALGLLEQAPRAPRVIELVTQLFAGADATGLAPEEFWQEVALPLLFIGAPAEFPPVERQDLVAFGGGLDPVLLFVDLVPYRVSAPEEGLLGAFGQGDVSLLDSKMGAAGAVRLLKVKADRLRPLLDSFDPARTREALKRFTAYLEAKGKAPPAQGKASLLDPALTLLSDLRRMVTGQKASIDLCVRHTTEAEALMEGAHAELRRSLQGPRIILL
jgi:hypothetical protein